MQILRTVELQASTLCPRMTFHHLGLLLNPLSLDAMRHTKTNCDDDADLYGNRSEKLLG